MSFASTRSRGFLAAPSTADVEAMAALDDIELAPGEADELLHAIAAMVEDARLSEELPQPEVKTKYPQRDPGYRPSPQEDPHNVFIRKCRIEGAPSGPLSGMTIGLKDNIAVAGVPTTNASRLLPHTPYSDAVVVERILDAGGVIAGKLNMDDYASGATGVTSVYGPARNPVDRTRSSGGSSGGSGAGVRAGEVDLALGVDQGGSGRIPAAFCGVVGVKATHGLVPTFGVTHIDHTIDSVTPIARTVDGAALLLQAIAGDDWRDPQWVRGPIATAPYTRAKSEDVSGLRVGIIEESMSGVGCEPAVLEGVELAAAALADSGAKVERISIPLWTVGYAVHRPYLAHLIANMIRSEGTGYGHLGYIDVEQLHAYALARRAQSRELSPLIKCWMITDRYLHERYMNVTYGKLHNLRLEIRRAISEALTHSDILVTPTIPFTAPPLLDGPASTNQILAHLPASVGYNTAPLNLSGHPAITVPSGVDDDGLPTGVQFIGPHFEDYSVFRVAYAFECAAAGSSATGRREQEAV